MDLDGIADFIALAECRSFSKAAERRHITQPAFSRRIQALENEIGVSLIDRSATPVALTKAGERFLTHAQAMTEMMAKAVDEAQSKISALADPVYVVTPHSLSHSFFPQWYRGMQRQVNGLNVRISTQRNSKCVEDVRSELANLAIVLIVDEVQTCFNTDGLESCVIGTDALVAVRAKIFNGNRADFLAYDKGSYMQSAAQDFLRRAGVDEKVKTVFESSSVELLRAMALAGFGSTVLQESLVQDDLKEGFLIPAFATTEKLSCRILLLRKPDERNAKATAIWLAAQGKALALTTP